MKEDIEKYRMDHAQEIIETFCKTQGINEARELSKAAVDLQGLIADLLDNSKISHRKIAALLEVSASRVHQVSRRSS